MAFPIIEGSSMIPLRPIAVALAIASGACAMQDRALAPSAGAPAYVPANATPPMLTAASNAIVGPVWLWQRTQLADGKLVTPATPDRYTLAFQGGGRMNLRADCNRGAGAYAVNGNAMKIEAPALTKMGCPAGSQDMEFLAELARVASYEIVDNELVLTLTDGGAMRFRAQP
jgi:heat shock protein HslJ